MKAILALAVFLVAAASQALAQDGKPAAEAKKAPLFINMTSGDTWRGWMGLHFANSTLRMGHPVTVFLNLEAVRLAAKSGEQEKRETMRRVPRDILAEFIKNGGVVLMCGPCMQEFGLKFDDLVPGVQMGRPGLTQSYIFAPGGQTLTW
jgi:predicted peroxiredoxin